jgi:hypothetical protein
MLSEKVIRKRLSPQEATVFDYFKRGKPAYIDDVFYSIYPECPKYADATLRHQMLGSVIHRINKHLAPGGYKIAPGIIKRTYQLQSV